MDRMLSVICVGLAATTCWLAQAQEPAVQPEASPPPLITNLDFSEGIEGWSAWSGTQPHAWCLDTEVRHNGKPSLRIDATDRARNLMVMTATDRMKPGQTYAFDVWWRTAKLNRSHQVDFRVIFRDKDGKWLTGMDLYPRLAKAAGEWTLRSYRTTPPATTAQVTVGVWVRETKGTVWVSDMSVAEAVRGQRTFDSMYVYDPFQVELGRAPITNFGKLKEAGSPFLARADRWNRLLVAVGFLQEDLTRARRAVLYAGRPDTELTAYAQAVDAALQELDLLQQTYGKLYHAGKDGELAAQFDPAAAELEGRVREARAALGRFITEMRSAAGAGALAWASVPKAPVDLPWWDAERRRPRYVFWTRWSSPSLRELEAPLNLGDGQTLTAGRPKTMADGVCDWSSYLDQAKTMREAGARRLSLITHYSLHDKGYLSQEFAERYGSDPDIYMWDKEGKPAGPKHGLCHINWLHPKVREHMVDVLTQMARFFKDRKEYQFYVSSWESAGPYAAGVRIGGNPSHATAFREWLKGRYGSVERLNQQWRSEFGGFDDVSPAPEVILRIGDAATPLYVESQRWAHETYVDYVKLIRDVIHRVDPTKPVVGEHSGLLSRVLSPRIFDSVDILGYHRRARTTVALQVWMSSLQRYTKKPTALFENFWGCQEDHPRRMPEEKVMRAQLRRYLYRHAVWGRCMQTWWYAYTSAAYLTSYNGNWCNPVYDLTTFRYSAAGLPVEKEKVDRLQALLLDSEIAPSRLLVAQPYASMLVQGPNSGARCEWLDWHHLLFPENLLYEALPDEWFAEGTAKLSDFDVVILPLATHLDGQFAKQLVEFLRAGGLCITSGPCGLYDELGREGGVVLAAAEPKLTVKREDDPDASWRFSYGAPPTANGWVEASVGRGKLILLPTAVTSLEDKAQELLSLIRARVAPAAEAPGTTLELLLRRLPDGRRLLCVLNRDPDHAASGEVTVTGAFTRIADVDMVPPFPVPGVVQDGRTRFRVTLDPGATAYCLLAE